MFSLDGPRATIINSALDPPAKPGEVEVINVREKLSIAQVRTPFQAKRGDFWALSVS